METSQFVNEIKALVDLQGRLLNCVDGSSIDMSKFLQLALEVSAKIELVCKDIKGLQKYEILRVILFEAIDYAALNSELIFMQKESLRSFVDGPLKFAIEAAVRVAKGQYKDLSTPIVETATVCCGFLSAYVSSKTK